MVTKKVKVKHVDLWKEAENTEQSVVYNESTVSLTQHPPICRFHLGHARSLYNISCFALCLIPVVIDVTPLT